MRKETILLLALAGGLLMLTGCQHVKPWQRGTLADPAMSANRDQLGDGFMQHIWFSREEADGGQGVGGGGCGCN